MTLFHAVPGGLLDRVRADLAEAAAGQPAFEAPVTEVMALGRGAAYRIEAPPLADLHERLQQAWWDHLTAQDRQGLHAHVTVQNKVTPEVARATATRLRAAFTPFSARAESLLLWRYVGGPWGTRGHVHARLICTGPRAVDGSTTRPFWTIAYPPAATSRRAARRSGSPSRSTVALRPGASRPTSVGLERSVGLGHPCLRHEVEQ